MTSRRWLLIVLSAVFLAAGTGAGAQWPSDPAQNLPIAQKSGEQVVPKIASTSDGGCYVGWYDSASGNYDVYLQRLDANGYEQWTHNGICVSHRPQDTMVTDWDLIADTDDCAVLVFSDIRDGLDLDVHAYRVSPEGQELWGADGVTLSSNDDGEPAPRVTQTSDGDFVFVWSRQPDVGDGGIQMQRLSPDGVPRFPAGGITVVSQPNEDPGFPALVPADAGSVIVIWLRDITNFHTLRHVRAQRFSAAGAPVWPSFVSVGDDASVPLGYGPDLFADDLGGALVLWHRAIGSMFNSQVQHLDASGHEIFPHNGVSVSTNANRNHLDPTLSYRPSTGEIFVFWNERNAGQSQWGIYGQKFTPAGARAWGEGGIALVPVNEIVKFHQRSAPYADGAMVFYIDDPIGGYNRDRVVGMRVDGQGAQVWPGSPIGISTLLAKKARLPIAQDSRGVVTLVWEDGRNDFADVYGQNVNPDGTLGISPEGIAGAEPVSLRLSQNRPNPFFGETRFAAYTGSPDAVIRVFDSAGRLVRSLRLSGGSREAPSVLWDGTDDRGQSLPGGVYFYDLVGGRHAGAAQRAVRVR